MLLSHVIDVVQVGIEGGVVAEITEYQCDNDQRPKSIQFDFTPSFGLWFATVNKEFVRFFRRNREQRQENHHKKYRSDKHQRTEKPEIVHGFGFHENQARESCYSGDVPDDQRLYHVFQRLAFVRFLLDMVKIMQRIINGNTNNH